ncbi:hypothetical protein DRJ17_02615 [Candidatus Woesearchaeota archaeon]|nr:MAG: hypothetical protein DRJ17_02615 [Candidatus Woesearchaeota archaeon]
MREGMREKIGEWIKLAIIFFVLLAVTFVFAGGVFADCAGSGLECPNITDSGLCGEMSGCSWGSGCSGSILGDCSNISNQFFCESATSNICYWIPEGISVLKFARNQTAIQNQIVGFVINATNDGIENLTNITINDYYDTLEFTFNNSDPYPNNDSDGNLTWFLQILAPNQTYQIFLNLTIIATEGNITNNVSVEAIDDQGNLTIDNYSENVYVIGGSGPSSNNLSIIVNKNALNSSTALNQTSVFIINITNTGITNITNITVNDYYNISEFNFDDASLSPDNDTDGNLTWKISTTLCPGNSFIIMLNLTTVRSASGTFYNRVNVTVVDTEGNQTNSQTLEGVTIPGSVGPVCYTVTQEGPVFGGGGCYVINNSVDCGQTSGVCFWNSSGFCENNNLYCENVTSKNVCDTFYPECNWGNPNYFNYSGRVESLVNGVPEYVNITVTKISFGPEGISNRGVWYTTTVNTTTGAFTVKNIYYNTSDPFGNMYMISAKSYTDSSYTTASEISPNLPPVDRMLMIDDQFGLKDATIYLSPATTINISAVNETGPVKFSYVVTDSGRGMPFAENFAMNESQMVNVAQVVVPADREYIVEVFPFERPPVRSTTSGISNYNGSYYQLVVNTSFTFHKVSGYVLLNGSVINGTTLDVVPFARVGSGKMIPIDATMPENLCSMAELSAICGSPHNDTFNASIGYYEIETVATVGGMPGLLAAFLKNGSSTNYYVGVMNYTSEYSGGDQQINISLHPAVGSVKSKIFGRGGEGGDPDGMKFTFNVTSKFKKINIMQRNKRSNQTEQVQDAHIEIETRYPEIPYVVYWMLDEVENSSFNMFFPNNAEARVAVFSNNYAPISRKINLSNDNEFNITLESFDMMEFDENGTPISMNQSLRNLEVEFFKSTDACTKLYPSSGCRIGEKFVGFFDPIRAMMAGKVHVHMKISSSPSIEMMLFTADLLSSGPPSAFMDNQAAEDRAHGAGGYDQVWKFGSFAPEIYDYVYVGIPINTSLVDPATDTIIVSFEYLYDDDWNVLWNASAGDGVSEVLALSDYSDYIPDYQAYFNGTGEICSRSNSSANCYVNTTANITWIKLPHFSGVGPRIQTLSLNEANISVEKTVLNSPISQSGIARFRINITNTGQTNITTINITDYYNISQLTYNASNPAANDTTDGNLKWYTSGNLLPGQSYIVLLNLTVNGTCSNNYTNNVNVTVADSNGNVGSDEDSDDVQVIAAVDVYEDDDNYTQAQWITTDGTKQLHTFNPQGDEDWMKFNTTAGVKYTIQTFDLTGGADTYLSLYDVDGTTFLLANDDINESTAASRLIWGSNENNTYYLKVGDPQNTGNSYDNVTYNISITEQTLTNLDVYEYDDYFYQARWVLTNGTAYSHNFYPAGDVDTIKFNVTNGLQYLIKTQNLGGGADTKIYLYNSNKTLVQSNDDDDSRGGVSSAILFRATYTGFYYVKTTDYYGTENGTYDILVQEIGSLQPSLVSPNNNINVYKYEIFNVTTKVRCDGGKCENIYAYLDPKKFDEIEESKEIKDPIIEAIERNGSVGVIIKLKDDKDYVKSQEKKILDSKKAAASILSIIGLENTVPRQLSRDEKLAAKKSMIKKQQDAVSSIKGLNIKKSYTTINAIAGNINRDGLERLKKNLDVAKIELDRQVGIKLSESVPLINANDVWAVQISSQNITGVGQTICVIDTGINYSHPAFGGCTQAQFLSGNCAKVLGGYDYVNDDADPIDDNGHGSHCAGIIASEDSTYKGVAPGAKIVAIKVLNSGGSGTFSDIIAGIDWCINNASVFNISVLSISIGDHSRYNSYCDSEASTAAVNSAVENGLTVVIATGNDGYTNGLNVPSCASKALSVSSTTKIDAISSFSNRGLIADVFAPGSNIISVDHDSGGFRSDSGTSMSTPHVAGAAALLKQYYKQRENRILSAEEVEYALQYNGKSIYDSSIGITIPRVDVLAAINAKGIISTMTGATPFYTISNNPQNSSCLENLSNGEECNTTWSVNATSLGKYEFFSIYNNQYNNDNITAKFNVTVVNRLPSMFDGDTTNLLAVDNVEAIPYFTLHRSGKGKINWSGNINISREDLNGKVDISDNYVFVNSSALHSSFNSSARITIYGLNYESAKIQIDRDDDGNFEDCPAPECSIVSYDGSTLIFDVQHFTAYRAAESPFNVSLVSPADYGNVTASNVTFRVYVSGNRTVNCTLWGNFSGSWQANNTVYNFNTPNNWDSHVVLTENYYMWNVKCVAVTNVSDYVWGVNNRTFTLAVNDPPTLDVPLSDMTIVEDEFNTTVDLDDHFSDPDSTITYYLTSSNPNISVGLITGNVINVTPNTEYFGVGVVNVTAGDGQYNTSDDFTVTVTAVNDAPVVITSIPNIVVQQNSYNMTANLTNYFSDVDNKTLLYYVSDNETNVVSSLNGNRINVSSAGCWYGAAAVTATAGDGEYNVSYVFIATISNIDTDGDGLCDALDQCDNESLVNLPANVTCISYIFNSTTGCHVALYKPNGYVINTTDCDYLDNICRDYHDTNTTCDGSGGINYGICNNYTNMPSGTYVNTTDCDYLDTICRNYYDVNNTCDGNGSIIFASCDSYVNDPGTTICNASYGVDYGCPNGTALGDDLWKQSIVQYCGTGTGACDGTLALQGDWVLHDACSLQETCIDNATSCQDITNPDVIINSPQNGSTITRSSPNVWLNVTFSEPVDSIYRLDTEANATLCNNCSSIATVVSLYNYTTHTIDVWSIDSASLTGFNQTRFIIVRDTDDDGTPDINDTDDDNDGIIDNQDTLNGIASNIDINVEAVNVTIDGETNLSKLFNGTRIVMIGNASKPIVRFDFNFSKNETLNLADISIKVQNSTSTIGSVIVRGLDLSSQSVKKSIYVDIIDTNKTSVCIKDEEVSSLTQISDGCNDTNEYYIICPGTSGDYSCALSTNDTQYKVSGLVHSAVKQQCTESWSCTSWSSCSSGTQTRTCTDVNNCGTINNKPEESQSCTITSTSGGGSSGGGGSFATYIPSVFVNATTKIYATIRANTEKTVSFDVLGIDALKVKLNIDFTDAKFTVAQVGKLTVPEIEGFVGAYVNISTNIPTENILVAKVRFEVSKLWISNNGINVNNVTLARYNGSWNELPTKVIREDSQYIYYEAETPGFSYFAITVKGFKAPAPSVEKKPEVTEKEPPVALAPAEKAVLVSEKIVEPKQKWIAEIRLPFSLQEIIVIISIIIVLISVIVLLLKPKRSKYDELMRMFKSTHKNHKKYNIKKNE